MELGVPILWDSMGLYTAVPILWALYSGANSMGLYTERCQFYGTLYREVPNLWDSIQRGAKSMRLYGALYSSANSIDYCGLL